MSSSEEGSEDREIRKRRVVRGEKKASENCCDCHGWWSNRVGLSHRERERERRSQGYTVEGGGAKNGGHRTFYTQQEDRLVQ